MKATELAYGLLERVREFGDFEVKTPDQMQPEWLRDLDDIELDQEREAYVLVAD